MSRVYGGIDPYDPASQIFTAEIFRHQQNVFPFGQFVALHGAEMIGLTVSMLLDFDPAQPFIEPWFTTISDGWLQRHNPNADWMYGVESCVLPAYQSRGVGGALMRARFDVARDLNLRGMAAGSALISYADNVRQYGAVAPDDYIRRVQSGDLFDTNLSKQIKKGFIPLAVIPDYLVDDPDSLGWGAVIAWYNPDYDPARGRGSAHFRTYTLPLRQA
jgi:GNAT superfamily N-acetyltransferase